MKVSDMMGKLREKENWEIDMKKSINLKENRIGEIYERRKSAKSKKKKLELIRECKITLTKMIENFGMTLVDAEERNILILKETILLERKMKEKNKKKIGTSQEDDQDEQKILEAKKTTVEEDWSSRTPGVEEEDFEVEFKFMERPTRCSTEASISSLNTVKTSENLRAVTRSIVKMTRKTTPAKKKMPSTARNSPMTRNMVTKLKLLSLPCVKSMAAKIDRDQTKPPNPFIEPARVCGNLAKIIKITKPSYVCSSIGAQNQVVQQWTRPPNQWGESRGTRQGSTLPINQSEQERQQRAGGQKADCL